MYVYLLKEQQQLKTLQLKPQYCRDGLALDDAGNIDDFNAANATTNSSEKR